MADEDDTRDPKPPDTDQPRSGDDPIDAEAHEQSKQAGAEFARLYETHIGRLIATARDDFGIEELPAIDLAHAVMMSFLEAPTRVNDVPGSLTGAISFASEAYVLRGVFIDWARRSPAPPDLTLPNGVRWRKVAGRLTPRFRRVLELRYVEGRTVAEMAEILGTTQRYVEALLERCLKQTEKFASEDP